MQRLVAFALLSCLLSVYVVESCADAQARADVRKNARTVIRKKEPEVKKIRFDDEDEAKKESETNCSLFFFKNNFKSFKQIESGSLAIEARAQLLYCLSYLSVCLPKVSFREYTFF